MMCFGHEMVFGKWQPQDHPRSKRKLIPIQVNASLTCSISEWVEVWMTVKNEWEMIDRELSQHAPRFWLYISLLLFRRRTWGFIVMLVWPSPNSGVIGSLQTCHENIPHVFANVLQSFGMSPVQSRLQDIFGQWWVSFQISCVVITGRRGDDIQVPEHHANGEAYEHHFGLWICMISSGTVWLRP